MLLIYLAQPPHACVIATQTEGRDCEEGAGEPTCAGRCSNDSSSRADKACSSFDQPSDLLPNDGNEEIEVANPLSSVAIDVANPLSSDGAPAAAAEQPAGGVSGRLARLKQLLWRKS